MSDPSPRTADGPSFWHAIRDFLNIKSPGTLRKSIEEAINEHNGESDADADDLSAAERIMLRNMLTLSDCKVGEIAVQRSDVVAIDESSDFPTIVRTFREAGHSRLPLYKESLDNVYGMLLIKDVYAVLATAFESGASPVPPEPRSIMRPVLFVPPSMPIIDLLTDMRRQRTHMAIVVDEYGGTDGIVSIEDIVEQIVGEIEDEHDEAEVQLLTHADDDTILADARIPLNVLEERLGASFMDEEVGDEVDTLGGLAFLMAGRVPQVGETIPHSNGWEMKIVASDGRRIERLLLRRPAATSPEEEGGAV